MERLTANDLMMVWPEDFGWPQDIAALLVIEGETLFAADEKLRLPMLQRHIESRLHLVPRFRQFLLRPRLGLGWPLWVDAQAFDITHHVRSLELPAPGDERVLLGICEQLRSRPLDRSRPLWEMWFLTGTDDGRVVVFMRVHHAIADGVTGVATLASFLDLVPDARTEPVDWAPRALPTRRALFADNVRTRTATLIAFLHAMFNPSIVVRLLREALPSAREAFGERAPVTSVNTTAGRDRSASLIRGSLAQYRNVAHAHAGTVNDVLLAAVCGGYRALLMARGDVVDDVRLRCFVPVSLPRLDGVGNRDAAMVVPLPVGEADSSQCLDAIVAETRERKKKPRVSGSVLFPAIFLQRLFLHLEADQHIMNAYVANVPGPSDELYLAGARVLDLFPLVPLLGNVTIGVGAMSYAGRLNVAVVADPHVIPDVDVFIDGFRRSIDTLTAAQGLARSA